MGWLAELIKLIRTLIGAYQVRKSIRPSENALRRMERIWAAREKIDEGLR